MRILTVNNEMRVLNKSPDDKTVREYSADQLREDVYDLVSGLKRRGVVKFTGWRLLGWTEVVLVTRG